MVQCICHVFVMTRKSSYFSIFRLHSCGTAVAKAYNTTMGYHERVIKEKTCNVVAGLCAFALNLELVCVCVHFIIFEWNVMVWAETIRIVGSRQAHWLLLLCLSYLRFWHGTVGALILCYLMSDDQVKLIELLA